jgi:hypothetical protein
LIALRWVALAAVLGYLGCSDPGIDREDELGAEVGGRFELVVLDSVANRADTSADYRPAPANAAVFFAPDGPFTVQVGVYGDTGHAKGLVRDLKAQGYPAYVAASDEGARVRIGYFGSRDDAERFGRIFAADRDVEYWVDRRANE